MPPKKPTPTTETEGERRLREAQEEADRIHKRIEREIEDDDCA